MARGTPRLRLFHWDPDAASVRAADLGRLGFAVEHEDGFRPSTLKQLRAAPPEVVVIDLSHAPSRGRDIGVALRTSAATRAVPLVFVDGPGDKVARCREVLPDATYTSWDTIPGALREALDNPPRDPVVPDSNLAGYSGTPLPKKLGLKEGTQLALLDPPDNAMAILGALPANVTLLASLKDHPELVIWFVRSLEDLVAGIATVAADLGASHLWIAWPKKTSALAADLSQQAVREAGLSNGLVDYKVCAIDATWSGLKFVRRKS